MWFRCGNVFYVLLLVQERALGVATRTGKSVVAQLKSMILAVVEENKRCIICLLIVCKIIFWGGIFEGFVLLLWKLL